MGDDLQSVLAEAVASLKEALGENLYSCAVYGSTVRGNAVEGISNLNLLIVLKRSDTAAHQAVARALERFPEIDPFILARRGFERSVRCFAAKFSSIRGNYRVLAGEDPLAKIELDPKLEKFLCEQAWRNLRLRMVYAFVTRRRNQLYGRFLAQSVTPLFARLAEVLRLSGDPVPKDFSDRIPLFEKRFEIEGAVLRDLIAYKQKPKPLADAETVEWHQRLFPLVDTVMVWMETNWPG